MLDRDLDEAEEQYQMALRNHLIRILKAEYDQEKTDIARSHDAETLELREMIDTINEEENAKAKAMTEAFLAEKEQIRNKNVEEQETMKMDLIKKIDALDNAFEVSFQQYMHETEPKTLQYSELLHNNEETTEKIKEMTHLINRTKRKTQRLTLKA